MRSPVPRRIVNPTRANRSSSSATADISAVSTSGARARGSSVGCLGMSLVNISCRAGAWGHPQAVMSSRNPRTLIAAWAATNGPTGRSPWLPRQVRVAVQARNASTWRRSSLSIDASSGNSVVRNSPNTRQGAGELVDRLGAQHRGAGVEIGEEGVADLGGSDHRQAALAGERPALSALHGRAVDEPGFEQQLAQPEHRRCASAQHRRGARCRGPDASEAAVKILRSARWGSCR